MQSRGSDLAVSSCNRPRARRLLRFACFRLEPEKYFVNDMILELNYFTKRKYLIFTCSKTTFGIAMLNKYSPPSFLKTLISRPVIAGSSQNYQLMYKIYTINIISDSYKPT